MNPVGTGPQTDLTNSRYLCFICLNLTETLPHGTIIDIIDIMDFINIMDIKMIMEIMDFMDFVDIMVTMLILGHHVAHEHYRHLG
jgi:hypothetical protein